VIEIRNRMPYITACADCDWTFVSKTNKTVDLAHRLHKKKCKKLGATSTMEDKIADFAKQTHGKFPVDYRNDGEVARAMTLVEEDMLNADGSLNMVGKTALAVANDRVDKGLLGKQTTTERVAEYLELMDGDEKTTHKYLGGIVEERDRIRGLIPDMELVQITPDENFKGKVMESANEMLATGRKADDWIRHLPKLRQRIAEFKLPTGKFDRVVPPSL